MERAFSLAYIKKNNLITKGRDIYEFGVYKGKSMVHIHKELEKQNLEVHKVYGFDSFVGLPSEAKKVPIRKGWIPGQFSAVEYFENDNIQSIIKILKKKLAFSKIAIEIIPGFFKDVLNKNLVEKYKFKPACFVEIDVDLYISAYQVLDFLVKNGLIVKDTIIAYNDWGGVEEFKGGESKAHKEITEKYGITAKEIFNYGIWPNTSKAFIIKEIRKE